MTLATVQTQVSLHFLWLSTWASSSGPNQSSPSVYAKPPLSFFSCFVSFVTNRNPSFKCKNTFILRTVKKKYTRVCIIVVKNLMQRKNICNWQRTCLCFRFFFFRQALWSTASSNSYSLLHIIRHHTQPHTLCYRAMFYIQHTVTAAVDRVFHGSKSVCGSVL